MSIKLGKLKIGGKGGVSIDGHSPGDVVNQVERAGSHAVHSIEGAGNEALHALEGAANQILHEVEAAVELALDEMFKKLSQAALHAAVRILKASAPNTFSLIVGPFTIVFPEPVKRVETLARYAQHPPGLDHFVDVVKALEPDKIYVDLSAQLSLVVISSQSLTLGFEAIYDVDEFVDKYHAIRGSLGL